MEPIALKGKHIKLTRKKKKNHLIINAIINYVFFFLHFNRIIYLQLLINNY